MPIQNLDLSGALDAQVPLATIASLSRQKGLQEQQSKENELQLQRLALQIQESKKKADDEKAITDIVKAGGTPEEVSRKLLQAGYPDQSRTYLTNVQADVLQAQQQAMLRAKTLEGQPAPEVRASAPQTTTAPIPTSLNDTSQVSQPVVSAPETRQVPLPLPKVSIPFIGQPDTVVQPLSLQQRTRMEEQIAQVKADMETRKAIIEAKAKIEAENAAKANEPYTLNPGGKRVIGGQVVAENAPKEPTKNDLDKELEGWIGTPQSKGYGQNAAGYKDYLFDRQMKKQQDLAEQASIRAESRAEEAAKRKIDQPNVPETIKTQVSAAYTTKDMIGIVRNLIAKKPQLVGPAAGRLEEASQGIGTTFGLQNQEDERDAATLSGHLAYLFANELRAAFPNRPNREIIAELKKASARIVQNPNMIEGMLRSAENNANIAIQGGKRWGLDIGKTAPTAPSNLDEALDKAFGAPKKK